MLAVPPSPKFQFHEMMLSPGMTKEVSVKETACPEQMESTELNPAAALLQDTRVPVAAAVHPESEETERVMVKVPVVE